MYANYEAVSRTAGLLHTLVSSLPSASQLSHYPDKLTVANRIVLFCPFFPLVLLFCQIIQARDGESSDADLSLLAEFTSSLESTCEVSEAIQQLHRLSQTLHNIASLYANARKSNDAATVSVGDGSDIYQYLNQLGSSKGVPVPTRFDETLMSSAMVDVQFGDWFTGNFDMMGLLEDDLSRFCP